MSKKLRAALEEAEKYQRWGNPGQAWAILRDAIKGHLAREQDAGEPYGWAFETLHDGKLVAVQLQTDPDAVQRVMEAWKKRDDWRDHIRFVPLYAAPREQDAGEVIGTLTVEDGFAQEINFFGMTDIPDGTFELRPAAPGSPTDSEGEDG